MAWPPERIVCLSEETAETLYLLGEEARIVGVTSYAQRPARIRAEKPPIDVFAPDAARILSDLRPDLALAWSELQADAAAALAPCGAATHVFNQRDVAGILAMIRMLGAMTGAAERGAALARRLEARIAAMRASPPARRPRVWVEEWDSPLIAGPAWVSELVEIAGGEDVAAHLRRRRDALDRIMSPDEVAAMRPELVIACWRGRRARPGAVFGRPGWALTPAGRAGRLWDAPATLLLAPGPAALTDGLDAIRAAVLDAASGADPHGDERAGPSAGVSAVEAFDRDLALDLGVDLAHDRGADLSHDGGGFGDGTGVEDAARSSAGRGPGAGPGAKPGRGSGRAPGRP
ncbi:ABC transporter substrate-binding protein [Rhodovulum sp. DZ06]|uniref:ABC transporter substrate-binding protein n=1 Tax=Rhodovulum sp. DZ06 TaxID=3425126 RepID=UPI003D33AD00